MVAPLLLSACLGAVIGLIRQWIDQAASNTKLDLGGVRTYSLWAMLGSIGAMLGEESVPGLLLVVLGLVGAHQIVAMAKTPLASRPGGTTFASALLTILVGALVFWDYRQLAVVVAATVMVLLGLKQPLHAWTRKFTDEDMRGTLRFVVITGIILPLVPNRDFGPLDAFNPFKIWLMVVLISGLGFLGYVAIRMLGTKAGILVTSLFGGIASSTATTLAFSRRSQKESAISEYYAFGIVVASSAMLVRVATSVAVLNAGLAVTLIAPFALMALPGIVYGAWLWFRRKPGLAEVAAPQIGNPLSLGTAVKFALLYALVVFVMKSFEYFHHLQSGLIPLSFISGLTDMDAIALSVAGNQKDSSVELHLATQAIVIAAVANSLTKVGIALALGSPALKKEVALVLGFTAAAGVAGALIF
ncbi:MAG: hypothetical protein JWM35_864 [Verrucomicrobia bacterium]|nr:hypothetical protein [Verrucomicrobiota bacterium]